jgi:hypothetical protein
MSRMGVAVDSGTNDEGPGQIVSVRGRPVGVNRSRFGASLVAVERGWFPVSSSGYWSLSGFGMGQSGPLAIKPEYLESLAENQDRERKALLVNLHRAVKPERDRKGNFIHVSLYVDKAINDAFFAPDHERAPLWQAAHRLLCLVDADPQFQPAPDGSAWNKEQCDKALANMRNLHACLKRFAQGDYSGELPMPLFGARAYAKLPPRPSGEPAVVLHEATIELSFNLKVAEKPVRVPQRPALRAVKPAENPIQPAAQLGLFSGEDTPPPTAPRLSV